MLPLDKKHTVLAATLLTTALAISILWVLILPQEKRQKVLFFPNGVTGEIAGEEHLLPREPSREATVHAFLEELILGPHTLGAVPVFPEDTEIELLMLRDRRLYVDFSPQILQSEQEMTVSFDDTLSIVTHNLRYNFPAIRTITYTVAGQLPGEPRFDLSIMGNNR